MGIDKNTSSSKGLYGMVELVWHKVECKKCVDSERISWFGGEGIHYFVCTKCWRDVRTNKKIPNDLKKLMQEKLKQNNSDIGL
jgi:hypothetical protein